MRIKVRCSECRNEQEIKSKISQDEKCIVCGKVLAVSENGFAKLKSVVIEKIEEYKDSLADESMYKEKNKCEICGEEEGKFPDKDVPTHLLCRSCRWKKSRF